MVDHAFYWLGDLTSQMYFQVGWGPFKIEVTAKMTISTPPSLPCHLENNRICNLKQWKSPYKIENKIMTTVWQRSWFYSNNRFTINRSNQFIIVHFSKMPSYFCWNHFCESVFVILWLNPTLDFFRRR